MYFDRLVKSLYGSLMKPNGFMDFLTELSLCLNLRSGIVTMFNHKASSAEVVWVKGLNLDKAVEYMRCYGHRDELMKRLLTAPVGQLIVMGDEETKQIMKTDPECVKVLHDLGVFYAAAAVLGHDDYWTSRLYFQRNKKQGKFTEEECILIERLLPHIQHAVQLYHLKMDGEQQHILSYLLFEQIRLPVILLNENGDINHCNRQAKQLLKENQYLQEIDKKLSWLHVQDNLKLQESIVSCLHERSTRILPLEGGVNVQIVLSFVPLIIKEEDGECGLAIFVYNQSCLPVNKRILSELYNLSDKETLVCCELIAGKAPTEIADVTFLSYQTVRTYIKRVMQKTDTNRQNELVAKILASPACNLIDNKEKFKR